MPILPRCGLRAALLASAVLLGAGPTAFLAAPASAQTVTEAQAADVAKQLQAWMSSIVGPKLPIPPDLLRVVPDGSRYRINLPIPALSPLASMQDVSGKPTEAVLSLAVKPLEGTRWRIEALDMPSRITLSPEGAAMLGSVSGVAPSPNGPKPEAEFRLRSQSITGEYDTSLATEARVEWRHEGISYAARNVGGSKEDRSTIDLSTGVTTLKPNGSGGVTIRTETQMEGYSSFSDGATGKLRVAAKRLAMRGELGALMTSQFTSIIQTVVRLAVDNQAGGMTDDGKKRQAESREGLRKVIAAMKGIMSGMTLEEIVEGLEVEAMGQGGGATKVTFGLGGTAPSDKFKAFLEVGLEGLKIAALPPDYLDLVPRSIVLRPVVGNIDVKKLTALAEEAAADDANHDALQGKLIELITKGGTELGLERLAIDLGFARLQASASAVVVAEDRYKGTGEVSITGFDALMDKAQKMPEGAMALPVMALLKGLAKTEGDRLIWRIAFSEDKKVLVNGMDISKLGGGK